MKQYIYKTTHCASYIPIILHVALYVEHETFTFLLSFFGGWGGVDFNEHNCSHCVLGL
jgi:hypothetical protein